MYTLENLNNVMIYATNVRQCIDNAKKDLKNPNLSVSVKGYMSDIEIAVEALMSEICKEKESVKWAIVYLL